MPRHSSERRWASFPAINKEQLWTAATAASSERGGAYATATRRSVGKSEVDLPPWEWAMRMLCQRQHNWLVQRHNTCYLMIMSITLNTIQRFKYKNYNCNVNQIALRPLKLFGHGRIGAWLSKNPFNKKATKLSLQTFAVYPISADRRGY